MALRMPPHPNRPGNRSWKRDADGRMKPDLSRTATSRPQGVAVERTQKRKGVNRGRQR